MGAKGPSPTECLYLIGLTAPQQVSAEAWRMRSAAAGPGRVSDPLPPMIPLVESRSPLRPPVPGLLPPCTSPLRVGAGPALTEDGRLAYLPVDASGWLRALASTLAQACGADEDRAGSENSLYPPVSGIPAAFALLGGREEISPPEFPAGDPPRWRVLMLECFRIEWIADRPWYLSVAWSLQWRRRLKRAPSETNNDKRTDLV